ncbi:MAG: hypothetical protein K8S21_12030 [Gemmatimonadetes bacterium]|nr:hypothetical protein [Gemmatimonadota bacterium]
MAAQGSSVRISVAGHGAPVLVDSAASVYTIAASRPATFAATARALAQLGIVVDRRDSVRGIVGMTNAPSKRTLAGKRMSQWLNCGSNLMGANADNWRVILTVYAFVDAVDSTSTSLRIAILGGARDLAGSSTETVRCASTGLFEEVAAERVRRLIAVPEP